MTSTDNQPEPNKSFLYAQEANVSERCGPSAFDSPLQETLYSSDTLY